MHRFAKLKAETSGMAAQQLLFTSEHLSNFLEQLRVDALQRLASWNVDDLLATPDADVIQTLLDVTSRDCPTLRRDEAYLLDPTEVDLPVREFGETFTRRVTQFTLVVPFDGDLRLFAMRATSSTTSPPRADVGNGELRLFCQPGSGDAARVRADFGAQLDEIERYLSWSRNDMNEYRQRMEAEIPRLVVSRRAKLLVDRELQANIGFPIKRRPDANTHAIPLRPRQVEPKREPARPSPAQRFEPEPVLLDGDYEAALAVLRNTRNALERSPSTTQHLNEEQIRDLLLVSLNAQFEGKAAGEVFNGAGKTDILIRVDDRNVFIGECKFWKGPKGLTGALNQLLGYLVWRDTKAALLLFIRDADVSAVTAKAITAIEDHPNYKRRGKTSTEERHDFVLHALGDPVREIHLALLPFLIAGKN